MLRCMFPKKKEKKKPCPGNGIFDIVCSKTDAHIYKFKNVKENGIWICAGSTYTYTVQTKKCYFGKVKR